MKSISIKRIRKIDQLIREERTGRPYELADELGISLSSLYYSIKFIKEEFNAPIVFDRMTNNYKYKSEGRIILSFVPKHIEDSREGLG